MEWIKNRLQAQRRTWRLWLGGEGELLNRRPGRVVGSQPEDVPGAGGKVRHCEGRPENVK